MISVVFLKPEPTVEPNQNLRSETVQRNKYDLYSNLKSASKGKCIYHTKKLKLADLKLTMSNAINCSKTGSLEPALIINHVFIEHKVSF